VIDWIQEVTGEQMGEQSVHEWLKSGVVLCKVCKRYVERE